MQWYARASTCYHNENARRRIRRLWKRLESGYHLHRGQWPLCLVRLQRQWEGSSNARSLHGIHRRGNTNLIRRGRYIFLFSVWVCMWVWGWGGWKQYVLHKRMTSQGIMINLYCFLHFLSLFIYLFIDSFLLFCRCPGSLLMSLTYYRFIKYLKWRVSYVTFSTSRCFTALKTF